MGEFTLIQQIAEKIGRPGPNVILGIGDDAAVLKNPDPESQLVFSSDAMVEGIHFDLNYVDPCNLGYKALAAALSDLAAMNAHGLAAVISLALPAKKDPSRFLDQFYQGAKDLAIRCGINIVGGDLTASKSGIFLDVAVLGYSRHPISRSGAKPGDWLAVSGNPGNSAAGLHLLQTKTMDRSGRLTELERAHLRPSPRFDLLPGLAGGLCTSLIDISDGLGSEANHLASQSQVGFLIDDDKLPLSADLLALADGEGLDPFNWCFSGGEDYELLATLDPLKLASAGGKAPPGFRLIGRATAAKGGVKRQTLDGTIVSLASSGFDHFATLGAS